MPWGPFSEQQVYNRRRDIHANFGGQQQGGICTPSAHPVIFCFTGAAGKQHGYGDGWAEAGVYRFFGEGRFGNMVFKRGNRAVCNHSINGKDVILFDTDDPDGVRFMGQFECAGYTVERAPDEAGDERDAIVFQLVPLLGFSREAIDAQGDEQLSTRSLDVLRRRAYEAGKVKPQTAAAQARRNVYERAADVRAYVLARANGVCESCEQPAPFLTKWGRPYLEPHHTRRVSDGGPDHPRHVGAVCPTCHREIHLGQNGEVKNARLIAIVCQREDAFTNEDN